MTLLVGRDSASRVCAAYAEVDAHGARLGKHMTNGMNTLMGLFFHSNRSLLTL